MPKFQGRFWPACFNFSTLMFRLSYLDPSNGCLVFKCCSEFQIILSVQFSNGKNNMVAIICQLVPIIPKPNHFYSNIKMVGFKWIHILNFYQSTQGIFSIPKMHWVYLSKPSHGNRTQSYSSIKTNNAVRTPGLNLSCSP